MIRKLLVAGLLASFLCASTLAFAADVYVTKNGKKYHKAECQLIKNKNPQAIAKEDATKKGLTPCQRCFKEDVSAKNDGVENTKVSSNKK